MKSKLTVISLLLFVFISSYSVTIKVPSEYSTIQAGMDAANTGDTVLIADGTYSGEGNLFLNFAGKAIVVKSENGPENCIIDCVDSTEAEVFQLINGETRESIVEGFKIIHGGLIIIIQNSSPTIKNNIFENDICGVVCGENSNPLIENNIISQCYRFGIYCYQSLPVIRGNQIKDNLRLGIYCGTNSNSVIVNNIISQNIQSGIMFYNSTGFIQNNTITENKMNGVYCKENTNTHIDNNDISENGYPGIYCGENDSSLIENNTISQNNSSGIFCYKSKGTIQNNIIEENLYYGIYYEENSNPLIDNNIISQNKRSGIYCNKSEGTIQNNDIIENSYHGIYCYNSSGIIQNNTVTKSWKTNRSGIALSNISSPSIKNNVLDYNYYGIYCGIDCNPLIENNTISNSYEYGIFCNESSPIIHKNQINNNVNAGVYCKKSSPKINGNLILKNGGNSFASNSRGTYDNHNRPSKIFIGSASYGGISINEKSNPDIHNNIVTENNGVNVAAIFCDSTSSARIVNNHIFDNSSISGGSVTVENSSVKIVNNIISDTKSSNSSDGLSRWYKDDLFARWVYDGVKLDYVTYYFGFINNGPPGEVLISGCTGLHKTVWAETGERFWISVKSGVSWGDGGGLYVSISLETSSFQIVYRRPDSSNPYIDHGCNFIMLPTITSVGHSPEGKVGAGIVVTNQDNMPEIAHNNVFGNSGGGYAYSDTTDTNSTSVFDLTGTDGNISVDPLLDSITYKLLNGSPCIDAGILDTTGLGIGETDFLGNPRFFDASANRPAIIDIGAFEFKDIFVGVDEYITKNQNEEFGYSIFPNPNNGIFNFKINSDPPENFTIKLINSLGQLIEIRKIEYSVINQIEEFNVSHLSKGIYHLVLTSDKYRESHKIAIQ